MIRLSHICAYILIVSGFLTAQANVAEDWSVYISEHAQPLEAGVLAPGDPLFDALAARSYVLLGESTHGTLEYYTWRSTITQALIEHAGFDFIAVEGDWSALSELDRYVRHLPGHAETAHAALVHINRWPEWMWANHVIEELAEWLHLRNRDKPLDQRVGIHGIDVYGWGDSLAVLPAALDVLEPGWGEEVASELSVLLSLNGDNNAFYRAAMRNQLPESAALSDIYRRLVEEKSKFLEIDSQVYWEARQKTGLIRQADRHLRKNVARHPLSWNPRAENFVETVERLADYYGEDARGIVWAHNTHIGDARHTPMREAGMVTVGQQARERFGADRVYLLGFASEAGTFRAGRQWGSEGEVMELRPSFPSSINHWLNRAAPSDEFWLPLQAARSQPNLVRHAGHRAFGVTSNPSQSSAGNYVPSSVPQRYDGLLFIRQTQALDPLGPSPVVTRSLSLQPLE
ncbi:MAG: erythromycin esterase family protein [Puniceicoccaceae bacterium]|nr:MAG: erythromycin esterase family protein [Puniceicoccaceae bacterium]